MAKAPLIAACLALALTGCTEIVNDLSLGDPDAGPGPIDRFDGDYFGRAHLVRGTPPVCPSSRTGMIEIGDRRLDTAYTPGYLFSAHVQPDGTMRDASGDARLEGRVRGNNLQVKISTPDCESLYDFNYIGNRS